ncbi:hypothetical protein LTS18_012308 [Coniosporium uncinatum]|uniref:Uncharacterized protein n=1 Tax=Coniosporium uncinatum TaxID=93489 RepID=A0ACC3CXX8_9PEZI|nr:hypothetical protein LTS18_012308 [Coniosporium uncinatum]
MASAQTTLAAATADRKSRLSALKSLKRKQPSDYQEVDLSNLEPPYKQQKTPDPEPAASALQGDEEEAAPPSADQHDVTHTYLSGRNYDPSTRGPKLGFESAPSDDKETLERRAAELALQERAEREKAETGEDANKPVDLFKLRPKKPNWDLKRDLERKMEEGGLNVKTQNAIARLVREKVEGQKAKGVAAGNVEGGDEGAKGLDMRGEDLVEAVKVREREDEEERKRGREADDLLAE